MPNESVDLSSRIISTNSPELNRALQGKNLVVDATAEAFFAQLMPDVQKALGTGGLGFLKGEEWANSNAQGMNIIGFMPGYAHDPNGQEIVWDQIHGDHSDCLKPLCYANGQRMRLLVPFNGQEIETTFSVLVSNGTPTILPHSEVLNEIYSEPNEGDETKRHKIQHFAFMAKAYTALFTHLGVAPDLLRINEPQLALMFQEVENVKNNRPESPVVQKNVNDAVRVTREQIREVIGEKTTKNLLTSHTPEVAALPFFVSKTWVEAQIGTDIIPEEEYKLFQFTDPRVRCCCGEADLPGGTLEHPEPMVYAVEFAKIASRLAHWINGVSREHGTEVNRVIFPTHAERDKSVYVTNGSDPGQWTGDSVATLLKDKKYLAQISGAGLHTAKQQEKAGLNAFFEAKQYKNADGLQVAFTDSGKMTFGLVRRMVEYKMQDALIPLVHWICGDSGTEYDCPDGQRRKGLNANVLIGGKARDEIGTECARKLEELASGDLRGKLVFINDTGTEFMNKATSSCDVWLHTPLETREACGTSYQRTDVTLASFTGGPIEHIEDGWNGKMVNVFSHHPKVIQGEWTKDDIIAILNRSEENHWVPIAQLNSFVIPGRVVLGKILKNSGMPNEGYIVRTRDSEKQALFDYYKENLPKVLIAPMLDLHAKYHDHTANERPDSDWAMMSKRGFEARWKDMNVARMVAQYNAFYHAVLSNRTLSAVQMQRLIDDAGTLFLQAQAEHDPLFAPDEAEYTSRNAAGQEWMQQVFSLQNVTAA